MKKIGLDLEHVEKQLAKTNKEIAVLRNEFWKKPEWDAEKAKLEAKIDALREWEENLKATKKTIMVMNNGGISKDVKEQVKLNHKPVWIYGLENIEQ